MSKYHAVKTEIDGIVFASKHEAKRYQELKLLERNGDIINLVLQPEFLLLVKPGKSVGKYIADFSYWDTARNEYVTEDAKGVRTPVYRLKKKIVEAVYNIKIEEV